MRSPSCVALPARARVCEEAGLRALPRRQTRSILQVCTWGRASDVVDVLVKQEGVTTGISAAERAKTIRALSDPASKPEMFNRPGHIFPLRYRKVRAAEGALAPRRDALRAKLHPPFCQAEEVASPILARTS